MKATDTNILVYASLADHPAQTVCEECLAAEMSWLTNVVNLIEFHRVLSVIYGVVDAEADEKVARVSQEIEVAPLIPDQVGAALALQRVHSVDFSDAVLLQTCVEHEVTALATDDRRLAAAARTLGIAVENPIDETVRRAVAAWERQHLPAKGLPRMLARVHHWIEPRDPSLATEFHEATQQLMRLP